MRLEDAVSRIRPRRKIHGISAVLLPFDDAGTPDLEAFEQHLLRTHHAGLDVAVNMDTGFGPELTPAQRRQILERTRRALGPHVPFVAGAMPFGDDAEPLDAYRSAVRDIADRGATPIVFPSEWLASLDGPDVADAHSRILDDAPQALAFELGTMFAPFGRIYDTDTFRRLLELPNLVGIKHSSLDRTIELDRLAVRDAQRPDFHVYTGNDLAIDMVMYGSDYLLGLSTFDPDAFALRDHWWAEGDVRFLELNDALQAVGRVAFRDPVPAYKHSAATYLALTGGIDVGIDPRCPKRPAWETDVLAPLAQAVRASRG